MANANAKRLERASLCRKRLAEMANELAERCRETERIFGSKRKQNFYRMCFLNRLYTGSFKKEWDKNVAELEKYSNGKFNRKLRHTWLQIGKGEQIMRAYQCVEFYDHCDDKDLDWAEWAIDNVMVEVVGR